MTWVHTNQRLLARLTRRDAMVRLRSSMSSYEPLSVRRHCLLDCPAAEFPGDTHVGLSGYQGSPQ